jgi:integrase
MARPGQYLHQPDNTSFWYVRFVYPWLPDEPKGRTIKHSLKTRVKAEAELLKLPHVARHLKTLAWIESAKRNSDDTRPCTTLRQKLPDGVHELPGGLTVTVEGDLCRYVAADGSSWEEVGNIREMPIPGLTLTRADYESRAQEDALFDAEYGDYDCPGWRDAPEPIPSAPGKRKAAAHKGDDGVILIQNWIDDLGIKPAIQREAWRTWNLFQELNGGKRLSEITRQDAVNLRHHMLEVMKMATITAAKNCGHLRAAFRHAITVRGYKGDNHFASLVSKKLIINRGDSEEGVSYSEEEMAIVRADLDNWRDDARLLWVLCATTGMRAGEAFLIKGETTIDGVRCVNLRPTREGEKIKTIQSKRWLPIPKQVLPLVPSKIEGPLFERSQSAVLHWANRRLADLGLAGVDSAKSLKSLRHRAVERLNTVRNVQGITAPNKLPEQITGHALDGVHNKIYFKKRHSMPVLKEWIDLIGY